MINRKAQEEIVGFVLIVVLVAVIFVIVLGLFLRGDAVTQYESTDIQQFLESALSVTTECAVSYEPAYSSFGELIRNCYRGSRCISGASACEVLNTTTRDMLDASFPVLEGGATKGYVFNVSSVSGNYSHPFLIIAKGNCSGTVRGANSLHDSFSITLSVC